MVHRRALVIKYNQQMSANMCSAEAHFHEIENCASSRVGVCVIITKTLGWMGRREENERNL